MPATRLEGLLVDRAQNEVLVFRKDTDEAHALNQTAAIVFDMCDGTATRTAMAGEIHRRTGLPADEGIVDLALAELVDAGLVTMQAADEQPAITRRSLIRRLALPAAVVAMLPVIETILVPPVYAQGPAPAPAPGPSPTPTPTPSLTPFTSFSNSPTPSLTLS
jgi:hypothetical protein